MPTLVAVAVAVTVTMAVAVAVVVAVVHVYPLSPLRAGWLAGWDGVMRQVQRVGATEKREQLQDAHKHGRDG